MDILTLCNLIGDITKTKIYPIEFPDIEEQTLSKLELTTAMLEEGGLFDFTMEIGTKASNPKDAERLSIDIINKLHRKTDIEYEGYQIVLITADRPYPEHKEVLEDGKHFYTCKFRTLACIM